MSAISSSDLDAVCSTKKVSCFFDPTTCQRQCISIPEKIVFYIAKNVTNAKTYQKLVESCKYFFKVNPVIVLRLLVCMKSKWHVDNDTDEKYRSGFRYDQPLNFKIWVTQHFACFFGDASKVIPLIYKNDATFVFLDGQPLKFKDFLFIAGNAEEVSMNQMVKYENGKTVQLEDIVENLVKLRRLYFQPCSDGSDLNCNTVRKLTENVKHLTKLELSTISEKALDVEEMFNFILENKRIEVDLCYRQDISDAYKERVQDYSNRLKNEERCTSRIGFAGMDYGTVTSSSEDDSSSNISFGICDDENVIFDADENEEEDLLFPWNNEEEEWELPWDI